MRTKDRVAIIAALVGALMLAFGGAASAQMDLPGMGSANDATGGGLEGPALGELGDTEHGECEEELLDIPALDACEDAEGRVIMDLPGLKLVGPADDDEPTLPETGANVGDIAAMGMAALAGGGVLLRRLRLSFAR